MTAGRVDPTWLTFPDDAHRAAYDQATAAGAQRLLHSVQVATSPATVPLAAIHARIHLAARAGRAMLTDIHVMGLNGQAAADALRSHSCLEETTRTELLAALAEHPEAVLVLGAVFIDSRAAQAGLS